MIAEGCIVKGITLVFAAVGGTGVGIIIGVLAMWFVSYAIARLEG